jgi:hypothetical protein
MDDSRKITNINDARARAASEKKNLKAGAVKGYERAVLKQQVKKPRASGLSGQVRWYHYLQLLLMLALVAWMMKSCGV